jgi:hypothetical protein
MTFQDRHGTKRKENSPKKTALHTDMMVRSPAWHGYPGPSTSNMGGSSSSSSSEETADVEVSGAPTDEGHYRLARFWQKALPPIIDGTTESAPALPLDSAGDNPAVGAESTTPRTEEVRKHQLSASSSDVVWTEVDDTSSGLRISGKGFNNTAALFSRLPLNANTVVQPPAVWGYSFDSAGLYTVFETTNARSLYLRWTKGCTALVRQRPDLKNAEGGPLNCSVSTMVGSKGSQNLESAYHFAATGMVGIDLYGWDESKQRWRYVLTTSPPTTNDTNAVLLVDIPPLERVRPATDPDGSSMLARTASVTRKWMVLWPSYDNAVSASIGVPRGQRKATSAAVEPPARAARRPIVWYGTSIAQGGVASRPGHTFTYLISSFLQRDVVNLAFNGNGHQTIGVAKQLVQIDAAAFVIDCEVRFARFSSPGPIISPSILCDHFRINHQIQQQQAEHALCVCSGICTRQKLLQTLLLSCVTFERTARKEQRIHQ